MREIKIGILKGIVKSFVITGIIFVLISITMLFVDLSDKVLEIVSVVLLGLESYMSAYFSTQIARTKGLLQGVICGSLIFVFILLLSIIFRRFTFSNMFFIKLIVSILLGAVGGIKGINTKHTKET